MRKVCCYLFPSLPFAPFCLPLQQVRALTRVFPHRFFLLHLPCLLGTITSKLRQPLLEFPRYIAKICNYSISLTSKQACFLNQLNLLHEFQTPPLHFRSQTTLMVLTATVDGKSSSLKKSFHEVLLFGGQPDLPTKPSLMQLSLKQNEGFAGVFVPQ